MEISRKSLVYKMAYIKHGPEKTNICTFFWRLILFGTFNLIFSMFWTAVWVLAIIPSFLYGHRPNKNLWYFYNHNPKFTPYKYWVIPDEITRIIVGNYLLTLAGIVLWVSLYFPVWMKTDSLPKGMLKFLLVIPSAFVNSTTFTLILIILCVLLHDALVKIWKLTEGFFSKQKQEIHPTHLEIFKAWMKAKKEKVCPIIFFTD